MTKKEAAAHAEQVDKLMLRVALCWTPVVGPDIPIESINFSANGLKFVSGWLPMYNRVEPACSNRVNHGAGSAIRITTQGARDLYSTRQGALEALRNEMETRFAKELLVIDREIEKERLNPTPLPDK